MDFKSGMEYLLADRNREIL